MSWSNLVKDISIISSYDAVQALSLFLSKTRSTIDMYFEPDFHPISGKEGIIDKIEHFPKNSLTIRAITSVREQEMSNYERKKSLEIRHMEETTGNYIIFDQSNYVCFLSSESEPTRLLIISNDIFVKSQLQLFSLAWKLSSTLRERRTEITQISGEFTRTITNPYQIIEELKISIKMSNEEIFLLCSTSNALFMLDLVGILSLLQKIARKVSVKLIVHVENNDIRDQVKSLFKEKFPDVSFQLMRKQLQTKIISIVLDRQEFIAVHINDATKELESFMQSCSYSNNQLKLNSAISLLESLWIQSGFDNQNVIKQAYFQMFKGFKIREEDYQRNWSFDKSTEKTDNI
ncbi:MAG TPA: hypothetical protein VF884_06805 [Nitrososphaeraceae archaeon]